MKPEHHTAASETLGEYGRKRNFRETPEPAPRREKAHAEPMFVIQEHHATSLHYDFRLEADGVLKSWAVTKEPSLDPAVKRLAIRVEDHPLAYGGFAGSIPAGHYGAGTVAIWDRGTFENLDPRTTVADGLAAGKLSVALHGGRLNGRFSLVRMRAAAGSGKKENWLLIKGRDEYARAGSPEPAPAKPRAAKVTAKKSKAAKSTAPPNVTITHPDKVLFPDDGITKGDLVEYYRTVADRLLPFLQGRPVTLERLPDGLGDGRPHFWQKNTPASYPAWVRRAPFDTADGKPVAYAVVDDLPTLLYLVNQGTVTFHPWLSRVDSPDRPDFVLFDLDPGESTFADAVSVARLLRNALKAEGREAAVKTSGKTGIHLLVPWADSGGYDQARTWAKSVAEQVAGDNPDKATVERSKADRHGRVYIDVMQNVRGHHAVPPYVVRAVPGAPVSTPLRWSEVKPDLDPKRFTLRTVPARLAKLKDDLMTALHTGKSEP